MSVSENYKLKEQLAKLRTENEQLKRELATDPLTGLGNYKSFILDIDRQIRQLQKKVTGDATTEKLSLLFIDVDAFKKVNEEHGHWAASKLLGMVGRRISKTIRENDLAYRYGGDEFVILVRTRDQDLEKMVLRIQNAIAEKSFSVTGLKGHCQVALTVSVGVRTLTNQDTRESLIEEADRALFEAKRRQKTSFSPQAA